MKVLRLVIQRIRDSQWLARSQKLRMLCKSVFWFLYRVLTLNRGVRVNVGGRGIVKLDYAFAFSNYESWGTAHNDGFEKLVEVSRNQRAVFDIGAHIGLCSLPLSRVIHEDGLIFAFEPAQANLLYLRRHIEQNCIRNVIVCPFLVGETSKDDVAFYEAPGPTGMNSVVRYKELEGATWTGRRQICLDDFCEENRVQPDVIKIDVEGAEIGVLRGAQRTLMRHHPTIILSVHPKRLALLGQSADTLLKLAATLGYIIHDMSGASVKALSMQEYILEPA